MLSFSTELTGCAGLEGVVAFNVGDVKIDNAERGTTMVPLEEDNGVGTDEFGDRFEEPPGTAKVKVETESCVTTTLTPSVALLRTLT